MKYFVILLTLTLLSACSGGDRNSNDTQVGEPPTQTDDSDQQQDTDQNQDQGPDEEEEKGEEQDRDDNQEQLPPGYVDLQAISFDADESCLTSEATVNYQALMSVDCPLLSHYGLFEDIQKPNQSFANNVTPYKLSVELFSDYARKYRAVYIPDGQHIGFDYNEAFDFPVGSVLVKTFSMPSDTANQDFNSERLIETRLLIKREEGWRGLPYQWVNDGEDAVLAKYGALTDIELIHLEQVYQFKYEIPSTTTCKTCHQRTLEDDSTLFSPIGVKARFLNWPTKLNDVELNQLKRWENLGYFGEYSPVLSAIDTVPNFAVTLPVDNKIAKGYLDVNCAHCHQEGGQGSLSGLRLEYWRPPTGINHGICKTPPGFDGGEENLHYDIVPGKSEESILPYRMSHLSAKDMMPPLGRATVHLEGVELIEAWIDNMEVQKCGD